MALGAVAECGQTGALPYLLRWKRGATGRACRIEFGPPREGGEPGRPHGCNQQQSAQVRLAQLALGRYGDLELRSNGGIEAGAGCRSVLESGEMEPSQVVVEVFGAAPDAQEGLDPL